MRSAASPPAAPSAASVVGAEAAAPKAADMATCRVTGASGRHLPNNLPASSSSSVSRHAALSLMVKQVIMLGCKHYDAVVLTTTDCHPASMLLVHAWQVNSWIACWGCSSQIWQRWSLS